jgi:hypothetical protein
MEFIEHSFQYFLFPEYMKHDMFKYSNKIRGVAEFMQQTSGDDAMHCRLHKQTSFRTAFLA